MANSIVIDQHTRGPYGSLLDKMFRARYELFHQSLGWDIPRAQPIEMDQYDRADTVYVVVEDAGEVVAYARLLSCGSRVTYGDTEWSYMLRDAVCGMLPGIPDNIAEGVPVPENAQYWEMTRLQASDRQTLSDLFAAARAYLTQRGAQRTIAFSRRSFVGILNRSGYPTTAGLVDVDYGGKLYCVMETDLNAKKSVSTFRRHA